MKVILKFRTEDLDKKKLKVVKEFIKYLQSELPLKDDVKISFVDKRSVKMTTGVRKQGNRIYVLVNERLLIDVLRTLAHEWTHEFQHQKLKLNDKVHHQDIGGPVENMANSLAGIFIKKFNLEFPKYKKIVFGED